MSAVRAENFATEAHGDQKYGDLPYVVHLHAVAREMSRIMNRREFWFYDMDLAMSAAYLHDVLEDTKTTAEDIRFAFGPAVAALVEAVTDEPGPNRKVRKALTYPKIRACGALAVALKLADRLANVRAVRALISDGDGGKTTNGREAEDAPKRGGLLDMYRKEHPTFRFALYSPSDGLNSVWQELEMLLGAP